MFRNVTNVMLRSMVIIAESPTCGPHKPFTFHFILYNYYPRTPSNFVYTGESSNDGLFTSRTLLARRVRAHTPRVVNQMPRVLA